MARLWFIGEQGLSTFVLNGVLSRRCIDRLSSFCSANNTAHSEIIWSMSFCMSIAKQLGYRASRACDNRHSYEHSWVRDEELTQYFGEVGTAVEIVTKSHQARYGDYNKTKTLEAPVTLGLPKFPHITLRQWTSEGWVILCPAFAAASAGLFPEIHALFPV